MSKSRLEKFLYALYSLDSSDLPTPLSRIEELYNCWVTGEEAPTFEPLSRVEKYLMAILGGYDVDSLPNPLSRVEVLLYKLATGDDNLDDVKTFLSEHEELLAEIIRNGGVGGNIDIEYVLYTLSTEFNTLYNTAEKPVKSAILKGNTLVNLLNFNKTLDSGATHSKDGDTITVSTISEKAWASSDIYIESLKPNTDYILMIDNVSFTHSDRFISTVSVYCRDGNVKLEHLPSQSSNFLKFNTSDKNLSLIVLRIHATLGSKGIGTTTVKGIRVLEYQEGMENWDIPYFEGMQSVKMPVLTTTGKNLLNNQNNSKDTTIDADGTVRTFVDRTLSDYVKVSKSKQYVFSGNENSGGYVAFFDNSKTFIERINTNTFTPNQDGYVRVFQYISPEALYQIEEGSVATTYEPYKSNILSTPEDLELREIGDVKDTLDLMTGEVTQRIGEIVLNGSESWKTGMWENQEDSIGFETKIKNNVNPSVFVKAISDKILYNSSNNFQKDGEYFDMVGAGNGETWIRIRILRSKLSTEDVEGFKKWLSQNNVKILYELSDKPIKTVDLSVVNQDGNDTKLSTFNDITHVTLSSEGFIPEVELEVATKNEEVLNTLSLEMDDISTTQNALKETSNTQSENVDATMIATTEIYEGLL